MGVKSIETELNKERVYNYIKNNPKSSTMQIAKEFGFTKSQTDYYIRPMVGTGILVKKMERNKVGKLTSFTIGKKSFVRKMKTEEEKVDAELQKQLAELPREVQNVARIVKLSNRHMQPPARKKRHRANAWCGSSMSMFDVM